MFKHILVPLDGSPLAETALPAALELAAKFNSQVTLLRVVASPFVGSYIEAASATDLIEAIHQQHITEAQSYLAAHKGSLRQQGFEVYTHLVEDSLIAESIIETAEAQNCDAIVMSTHGRGGLSRWVYGSIADKILRHADIPVLLIRSRAAASSNESDVDIEMPVISDEEDMRAHDLA